MPSVKALPGVQWDKVKALPGALVGKVKARGGLGAATASSYLLNEDFETPPVGWTNVTGTPDYQYATTPAPLRGDKSLYVGGAAARPPDFAAQSDVWVFFRLNYGSTPSANTALINLYNAGTTVVSLQSRSVSGEFRLICGSAFSTSTGWLTGTTYFVWVRYVVGTGANAQAVLYRGTTTTRPTALSTINTGTSTLSCDRLMLQGINGVNAIFDQLLVSATEIGDVAV